MELFSSVWHIVSATVIFIFGLLISLSIAKKFQQGQKRSLFIYLWHTVWCVFYAIYVLESGGDAVGYYLNSFDVSAYEFSLGTAGLWFFVHFFSAIIGLSYLGVFLVFNIFGFVGLLAFDASLRVATWGKSRSVRRLATLIIFLPSVSFWSSAIGKDSLSFMATGLALWSVLNLGRRIQLMMLAVALMLFVRPHMAGLMVIAIGVSMVFEKRIPVKQRVLFGGATLAGSALLVPFALDFSGASKAVSLAEYVEQRQGYNLEGGGAVDIASMSPPMQLFTYLFRPLPYEAHSVFSFAASLDNLVLLFLFFWGGWEIMKRRKNFHIGNRVFLWVYSLSAWMVLAFTTANLGISVRQKWMFAPMIIFLLISLIGRPRQTSAS